MGFRRLVLMFCVTLLLALALQPRAAAQSSSSASKKQTKSPAVGADSPLDAGAVSSGVYRNKTLGFSCKVPSGWVLRTEEMNAREEDEPAKDDDPKASAPGSTAPPAEGRVAPDRTGVGGCPHAGCGRVLLGAFSRPPQARGEDVNGSIVIAAESVVAYPGLKEAVQYFGPVTEVAKAQGFAVENEPYEFLVGTKALVRGDFQKDVGTRVMRQSTLVMLARGEAISFTFIGGTEEEVEGLVEGLSFTVGGSVKK